ncbi:hypothetical protein AXF42_Ash019891 [Apostasia shenzhenica]|uniref:Uncharacterized protein n=1 Tax=Apostasia shenzhenica TaxID=1088818 RepID=A0A2H9ZX48_9ASPA|nr:hypothetical protein AXF42_Ash019891 [Apostasia shenzhenica]
MAEGDPGLLPSASERVVSIGGSQGFHQRRSSVLIVGARSSDLQHGHLRRPQLVDAIEGGGALPDQVPGFLYII